MAKQKDKVPMKGKIKIELKDKEGEVKQKIESSNTFMDAGDAHVADQLAASSDEAAMGFMAVGTSSTVFSATDTTLGSEIDRNSLDGSYPEQSAGANDNDVVYKASWAAGDGTGALNLLA